MLVSTSTSFELDLQTIYGGVNMKLISINSDLMAFTFDTNKGSSTC